MTTKRSKSKTRQQREARPQTTLSPLNSSVRKKDTNEKTGDDGKTTRNDIASRGSSRGRSSNKKKKRREMSESKLSEEAALTERLFGGDGALSGGSVIGGVTETSSAAAAWMDDDEDAPPTTAEALTETTNNEKDDSMLFAIDRSGEEVTDDVDEGGEDDGDEDVSHGQQPLVNRESIEENDEESMEEEEADENKASMKGAAWQDSESDSDGDDSENESNDKRTKKGVSLVDGPNRLKKLRRYRDETDPVSVKEYELRLRERFVNTASVAARTDWADVGLAQQRPAEVDGEPLAKKKRGYGSSSEEESDDEDDAAQTILESNASLFATSSSGQTLPPTLLNVVRTRDGNLSDPNNSVVSALQFHPGSDEDNPLLMTAGMDKMLRFFRIDEEEDNPKIHGIHFPKMPITCASFLGDSGSVVLSGRRPFFYVYDALSGKIQKVPSIVGRTERSLEKFSVSRDGKMIAFMGNDGYVILVDGKTRQWVGDLKMNGSVRAIEFEEGGEYVLGSGSDGDVYRWHIGSRRCVERFHNEDGTITSSLAVSSNFLAVGAESGVVNLYNDRHAPSLARGGSRLGLASTNRAPLKSIMNLTTSADNLRFNHDGDILAMSTKREMNGLKLLHVPTATVFSNWPTSKTPLKYVWSMDFSPGSRYLAVGNDHGKCLLYRLKHYWDE